MIDDSPNYRRQKVYQHGFKVCQLQKYRAEYLIQQCIARSGLSLDDKSSY